MWRIRATGLEMPTASPPISDGRTVSMLRKTQCNNFNISNLLCLGFFQMSIDISKFSILVSNMVIYKLVLDNLSRADPRIRHYQYFWIALECDYSKTIKTS